MARARPSSSLAALLSLFQDVAHDFHFLSSPGDSGVHVPQWDSVLGPSLPCIILSPLQPSLCASAVLLCPLCRVPVGWCWAMGRDARRGFPGSRHLSMRQLDSAVSFLLQPKGASGCPMPGMSFLGAAAGAWLISEAIYQLPMGTWGSAFDSTPIAYNLENAERQKHSP